jgi:Zn-dependent protease
MPGTTNQGSPKRSRGSVRIARLLGVDILLHWTFPVLLLLVIWSYWSQGRAAVASGLVWVVAIFASVVVHELAHCVVARRRGAVVLDILLTPIGGMSQLNAMPESASDELAVAIVGPLTSFGLALLAAFGGLAAGASLWPPTLFAGSWFARLLWLNLLLGAFNMLPALPMDGGRVLRASLARRYDRRTATHIAVRFARYIAFLMLIAGLFYDFWLIIIGIFLLVVASAEEGATSNGTGHDDRAGPGQTTGVSHHPS